MIWRLQRLLEITNVDVLATKQGVVYMVYELGAGSMVILYIPVLYY